MSLSQYFKKDTNKRIFGEIHPSGFVTPKVANVGQQIKEIFIVKL